MEIISDKKFANLQASRFIGTSSLKQRLLNSKAAKDEYLLGTSFQEHRS